MHKRLRVVIDTNHRKHWQATRIKLESSIFLLRLPKIEEQAAGLSIRNTLLLCFYFRDNFI